jgi:hypothetical protein
MDNNVKKEIKNILEKENMRLESYKGEITEEVIEEFKDVTNWCYFCFNAKLSENFIREFKDEIDWFMVSRWQRLSEDFIREFQNKVYWGEIFDYQKLSENFIREFQNKVDWGYISMFQQLSENFIREFQNKINWGCISANQQLSENFIREFKNKVDWGYISKYQKLSENFIKEFEDKINKEIQYAIHHDKRTEEEKIEEIKNYVKLWNLEFDGEYLYAYRNHDQWGRGYYNKTIFYEKGKYYRDWRCDLNPKNNNSFGFGVWPVGKIKIKIKVDDWGVIVEQKERNKARVWGFEIIQ